MMRTIRDMDLAGKRVLIRADFNVPIKDGKITDETRIRETLPTIRLALEKKARRVVLCSHLGRPQGRPVAQMSLRPVARRLEELLGRPVAFDAEGDIMLLENLRFDPGETKNDPEFARGLAARCDVYINDAFGAAHRAHASVEALARLVPERGAGLLLARELEVLGRLLENPARPFVVVLGGAKVEDKLRLVENILPRVDRLLLGGGMAFTFLAAMGKKIGASIVATSLIETVEVVLEQHQAKFVLPVDAVVDSSPPAALTGDLPEGRRGMDIGPQTVTLFRHKLADAKTIFWNGPMGVFERPEYASGTRSLVTLLSGLSAVKVVGGGDTIAAISKFGNVSDYTHVSTGGGASMEFLEGARLPGVEALR
jgi:3-phosphoglycerate kinase